MRKIFYFFFILLAITACQEDPLSPYDDAKPNFTGDTYNPDGGGNGGGGDGGGDGGATGKGTISASIDGQAWSADKLIAMEMQGLITIVGSNLSTSTQVGLLFDETISVGTHNFDDFTITGYYTDNSVQPPVNYNAHGPAIEILSIDTTNRTVSGVFTFTAENPNDATDKISVSNGTFNVTYVPFSF